MSTNAYVLSFWDTTESAMTYEIDSAYVDVNDAKSRATRAFRGETIVWDGLNGTIDSEIEITIHETEIDANADVAYVLGRFGTGSRWDLVHVDTTLDASQNRVPGATWDAMNDDRHAIVGDDVYTIWEVRVNR